MSLSLFRKPAYRHYQHPDNKGYNRTRKIDIERKHKRITNTHLFFPLPNGN